MDVFAEFSNMPSTDVAFVGFDFAEDDSQTIDELLAENASVEKQLVRMELRMIRKRSFMSGNREETARLIAETAA